MHWRIHGAASSPDTFFPSISKWFEGLAVRNRPPAFPSLWNWKQVLSLRAAVSKTGLTTLYPPGRVLVTANIVGWPLGDAISTAALAGYFCGKVVHGNGNGVVQVTIKARPAR